MDPFNDQDLAILLNLTDGLRSEVSSACIDAARLQRAPEGPGQSAGGRGNDVVEGRGVRRIVGRIHLIMLCDIGVDPERDWLLASRKPGIPDWTTHSFDLHD